MAIRLVNGCANCQNLTAENICKIHETKVEAKYTCDSFDMRPSLKDEVDCTTCAKYQTAKCPNKLHAAADMLCNDWTPNAEA